MCVLTWCMATVPCNWVPCVHLPAMHVPLLCCMCDAAALWDSALQAMAWSPFQPPELERPSTPHVLFPRDCAPPPIQVSPRDLTSDRINQAVCVFGIVTKCSLVRPKVVKSVHYCEATKLFTTREYRCGRSAQAGGGRARMMCSTCCRGW